MPKQEKAGPPFVDHIRETIRRHRMFARGDTVVVAASGGPDSTALVHALAALRPEFRLTIHLAHLNHRLRTQAADDAAFVEAMGGFIRFTSSEGAGTIFDVWLPGERSPRTTNQTPDGAGEGKPKAVTAA